MSGRYENKIKLENKIKKYLSIHPYEIIESFSFFFGDKTETTKYAYLRYAVEFVEYFGEDKICSLKPSDINKYFEMLKYSHGGNGESIRAAKLAAVKFFYEFLIEDGYMETSPAACIKPPKFSDTKEIVSLTPKEVGILKNNVKSHGKAGYRDMAIISLGCNTGLRVTALTEIDIDDVDPVKSSINVIEKGNVSKTIYLGEETMKTINAWIENRKTWGIPKENKALFVSKQKHRLCTEEVRYLIKKYSAGIDKHITPHKLRSTCATNLYDKTGDIYLVAEILGHKNLSNTRRYARMSEEKRKGAVKLLDELY